MNDARQQAYALLRVIFNGNSPATFNNFFADLCERCNISTEFYELADKCFDELAQREVEKTRQRLYRRLDMQRQELENNNVQ